MTYLVMALALALGFTQCKKEQPTSQTEGVRITLTVDGGNSNSRAVVNPTGNENYATVRFEQNDVVYVAYKGNYVGALNYCPANGSEPGYFSGSVNVDESIIDNESPLYFYFLGGEGFQPEEITGNTATVVISDQSSKYPVISCSPSNEALTTSNTSYSAVLKNKVSIMKFNVTTPSEANICITGMNNQVTLDFSKYAEIGTGLAGSDTDNGFTYGKDGDGIIKMAGQAGGVKTYWAIVLPQDALTETGEAYSEDRSYIGTRPPLSAISSNQYLSNGITMNVNTHAWDVNSVFLHINNAGNTYSEGGFTVTATDDAFWAGTAGIDLVHSNDKLTFESTVGNITKIEITIRSDIGSMVGTPSSGWSYSNYKLTWTGTPSSTVDLGCVVSSKGFPGQDDPGVDPGSGGGTVIIENAFELNQISQVQFTVQ